jgi:hypothetical protein
MRHSFQYIKEKVMIKNTDWLPGFWTEILAMCLSWILYLTEVRRAAWGIPEAEFTELKVLCSAAQAFLQKAQNDAERTHVITVECQEAFKALAAKMRFFRDWYFKILPLTEGDWAALGFRRKDTHPSPVPAPDGVPAASLSYTNGPHALTIHLGPLAGTLELDPESDYGFAIYVGILFPGGATLEEAASEKHYLMKVPADGKGLQHYRFTRRRKEKIILDAEDAGKTVYICCRATAYENRKGRGWAVGAGGFGGDPVRARNTQEHKAPQFFYSERLTLQLISVSDIFIMRGDIHDSNGVYMERYAPLNPELIESFKAVA